MSATETAAVPAEEVKAAETPAPAPEAAPAAEAPAAVRLFGYLDSPYSFSSLLI